MTATLFDGLPMFRTTDPATSREAAKRAAPNAETHRGLALRTLRAAGPGGMTDFELAALVGIQQTSIGKRRGELVKQGLVVNAGFTRPSPSGSPATVWRAT